MAVESLTALTFGALSGRAMALWGGVGAAAITGLYLLRQRRRRALVAFAPLWLGTADEARATQRSRRLRHWISLGLALAVYGALLLGAGDPRPAPIDRAGRSLVVLLDRSASMSATDEPGTRLGAAKARARQLLAGLGADDRALIASFAAEATAESGFESDPDRLDQAIARVSPSDEPGDLPRALAFAAALLRGRPRPTVIIVSDGGFPEDERRAPPPGLDLRYLPVGRRADNAAILSFAARRIPADPGTVEVALVVQSFRPVAATVGVEIESRGAVVQRSTLRLAPGERRRLRLAQIFTPDAELEAHLTSADDLPGDDRASTNIPALPRARVLLVGAPDLYLDGALLGLGRTVQIERLGPAQADRAVTLGEQLGADLVIFDGATPSAPPSVGRYLYLDPHGAGSPFPSLGRVRSPVLDPASVRRDHPLLRGVDLTEVNVAEARRLTLSAGDRALAGAFGLPLVVARERAGLRIAALAFDPRRSDLPLRPAFPLLIANAVAWSGEDRAEADASPADSGTQRAAAESDLTPAPRLVLAGRPLPPPDAPAGRRPGRPRTVALGLAAALLLFEWLSYHRRWTT